MGREGLRRAALDRRAEEKKYPDCVTFSKEGFPELAPYAEARRHTDRVHGQPCSDFSQANRAFGFKGTPKGSIWPHVEDGRTMLLVPKDLHEAVAHIGGFAIVKPPQ